MDPSSVEGGMKVLSYHLINPARHEFILHKLAYIKEEGEEQEEEEEEGEKFFFSE